MDDPIQNHSRFKEIKNKAAKDLKDSKKVQALVRAAAEKIKRQGSGFFKNGREQFQTLLRLLKAYAKRDYTVVPWRSLVLMLTAVLYFVMPLDVVPDFLFSLGLLDDIAVLSWVMKAVQKDLDRFQDWEEGVR
ncbi:MAG: DUF1232 domain-containing protein [Deltaproteobacteria bacterium]|nr:DUF1232 domain-containing protein [Deltaproteobacteria bacterium]